MVLEVHFATPRNTFWKRQCRKSAVHRFQKLFGQIKLPNSNIHKGNNYVNGGLGNWYITFLDRWTSVPKTETNQKLIQTIKLHILHVFLFYVIYITNASSIFVVWRHHIGSDAKAMSDALQMLLTHATLACCSWQWDSYINLTDSLFYIFCRMLQWGC